jgi:eukaryotic-like serine/threonine-protein kinase
MLVAIVVIAILPDEADPESAPQRDLMKSVAPGVVFTPPKQPATPRVPVPLPQPPASEPAVSEPPSIEMPAEVARAAKKPGLLSIDSTPYATIFVDGVKLGVTPLVKRPVPAGRHKLRAVLADGRTRQLALDIDAGKLAPPIQLTW